MGKFSRYTSNEILDHIYGTGSWTAPTTIFTALCTSAVTLTDLGRAVPGELSGGAYARIDSGAWDASSLGAIENTATITFATATANLATVTWFALCDELSTGNMIGYGKLGTAKNIASGDQARFIPGAIDVTLT